MSSGSVGQFGPERIKLLLTGAYHPATATSTAVQEHICSCTVLVTIIKHAEKSITKIPCSVTEVICSSVSSGPATLPGVGFSRQCSILVSGHSLHDCVTAYVPNLVPKPLQSFLDGEGNLVVFVDTNVHWKQLMVEPGIDYGLWQSSVKPQVIHHDLKKYHGLQFCKMLSYSVSRVIPDLVLWSAQFLMRLLSLIIGCKHTHTLPWPIRTKPRTFTAAANEIQSWFG